MFMAHCSSSAKDIHRADANIKGMTCTYRRCCDVMRAKLDILLFIPCHKNLLPIRTQESRSIVDGFTPAFPPMAWYKIVSLEYTTCHFYFQWYTLA